MREQSRLLRKRKRNLARVLLAVFCLAAFLGVILPNRTEASEPLNVITIQVETGDSLWMLADKYDNNTMDIRKYIYLIQQYNNMENSTIYPGQLIYLPIYS